MPHHHVGRPTLDVSETARIVATTVTPLTRAATGNISTGDACFLLSLLEKVSPTHVLELGVASGTSTLMMLKMMDAIQSRATLDSVDLATAYYDDPSKPVGYLVAENYAALPGRWRLATGVGASSFSTHAEFAGTSMAGHYDLVFIDAHHGHPWPTLDALCLLPFVVPGSWLAFHDINLPLLGDYPYNGAVYVVRDWPGDVVISDDPPIPNIGAIRLSATAGDDAARLIPILSQPWDCGIHAFHAKKILTHLAGSLTSDQYASVSAAFERNARLPSD
jgi:predicted O-methyltransferase YrrM